MTIQRLFKYIIIFSITLSCAAGRLPQQSSSKVINLGKASEYDIYNTIPRLLRKYHYEILHGYDTGAYQSIETEWKTRFPMGDEREVGGQHG